MHETGWLSAFTPCKITTSDGLVWRSVEHLYQAYKSSDPEVRERVRSARSAFEAKKAAPPSPPGWREQGLVVMKACLKLRYEQNAEDRLRLLDTTDEELVHYCPWGDAFWGVTDEEATTGSNYFGRLTMEVRDELSSKP